MKNHVHIEPVSMVKRRRIAYARNRSRNIWAIWTLILGGCTMTIMAMVTTLHLHPPH